MDGSSGILKAAMIKIAREDCATAQLRVYRDVLLNNEPISRREGRIAQANLEAAALVDVDRALRALGARP